MSDNNISYEELFSRYENLKTLLHETSKQTIASFQTVTKVITDHTTAIKNEGLNAVSFEIDLFRNEIKLLLNNAFTDNMDLYQPSNIESKLKQLENEKLVGYQTINDLQKQIKELKEKQLEMQSILVKYETINDENENPNNDPAQEIQQLKKDNLDLRHLVDTLRATTKEYKNRALNKEENRDSQHLLHAVKTDWKETDLDVFQEELQNEFQRQNKETLCRMTDNQMGLRLSKKAASLEETKIEEEEEENGKPPFARLHSVTQETVTDWDQEALNELNMQMKEELGGLMMIDKQSKLENIFRKRDMIRETEYRASGTKVNEMNEENEEEIVNGLKIIDENFKSVEMSEIEISAMQNEIQQMNKSKLLCMSERNMIYTPTAENLSEDVTF